jgi:hypothetical protein
MPYAAETAKKIEKNIWINVS